MKIKLLLIPAVVLGLTLVLNATSSQKPGQKPPPKPAQKSAQAPRSTTVSSSRSAADSLDAKLCHIRDNGNRQSPDQTPTVLTDDEVNAYFAEHRVKLPAGVESVRFHGDPGIITANARVDFDQITSNRRSANPLLALFTGVHDVRVVAHAIGNGGQARIDVDSVAIDDVNVPRMALQFFADRYLRPRYPNAGLNTRFQMPSRIDTATVGAQQLAVTQK